MRERRKRTLNPVLEGTVKQLLTVDRKALGPERGRNHDLYRQAVFGENERRWPDKNEIWHFWMWCENTASELKDFLDFEQRDAKTALHELLASLRSHNVGVLDIIADMLDPTKPGPWKLELRRNVRGAPSEVYGSFNHWVAMTYFELLEELQAQGVRSPAKEAARRLIERYKFSDNDIRRAVQWWRKHGLKLKR
jgi:hypothetical protein